MVPLSFVVLTVSYIGKSRVFIFKIFDPLVSETGKVSCEQMD